MNLAEITEWMWKNMLKLNEEKIEVLVIPNSYYTDRLHETELRIGGAGVQASESACNLGMLFDSHLDMSIAPCLCRGHHDISDPSMIP